jgi:hypothetical protein
MHDLIADSFKIFFNEKEEAWGGLGPRKIMLKVDCRYLNYPIFLILQSDRPVAPPESSRRCLL